MAQPDAPHQSFHGQTVQTVLGPINPTAMGHTQTHEHIFSDLTCLIPAPTTEAERRFQRETISLDNYFAIRQGVVNYHNLGRDSMDEAIEEMRAYQAAGGGTIVDSTSADIGRDPRRLAEVSRRTSVHVVMGSGYYVYFAHPPGFSARSVEAIAEEIVHDLRVGVGDTAIRAGMIGEIGLSYPIHPDEEKSLHAACLAQRQTQAPLQIHPGRHPTSPMSAMRLIERFGADPNRVIMSHIDRTIGDLDGMIELAKTGCYLEFDLFGQESSYYFGSDFTGMPNDAGRVRYLAALADAGFATKLVISQDICQRTHTTRWGGEGFDHLLLRVLPLMRRLGQSAADIHRLCVANPAAAFANHWPA